MGAACCKSRVSGAEREAAETVTKGNGDANPGSPANVSPQSKTPKPQLHNQIYKASDPTLVRVRTAAKKLRLVSCLITNSKGSRSAVHNDKTILKTPDGQAEIRIDPEDSSVEEVKVIKDAKQVEDAEQDCGAGFDTAESPDLRKGSAGVVQDDKACQNQASEPPLAAAISAGKKLQQSVWSEKIARMAKKLRPGSIGGPRKRLAELTKITWGLERGETPSFSDVESQLGSPTLITAAVQSPVAEVTGV